MASSGSFSTWNPLRYSSTSGITYSQANCKVETTGGYPTCLNNFAPKTGKWYVEFYNHENNGYNVLGIVQQEGITKWGNFLPDEIYQKQYLWYSHNGNKARRNADGTGASTSYGSSWGSGNQIIGCALDLDNGKVWWSLNGTFQASGNPASGTNAAFDDLDTSAGFHFAFSDYNSGADGIMGINCGQDSTFGGATASGGNADGNGFGDFKYEPPSGFLALCTANLALAEEIDPAETDDNFTSKQFGVLTFTGTGTARTQSGLGFQPDLIWAKRLSGTGKRHYLVDSTRGFTKYLHTDQAVSEGTSSDGVTAATSDGFDLGGSLDYINENTSTYVAWCWRCNGGTTSTNSSGTITSTVQANQDAGFSIVKWTSNNSNSQTIGHGLSKAPRFIISKPYSASTWSWHVFHHYQGSIGKFNFANNATGAFGSGTNTYGAMPGASVFTVGTAGNLMPNNSTTDVISYCWHDVDGLQRFGVYEGNGNADGPYIHLGFRPRLFVQKRADSTGSWRVWDSERHPFSYPDAILRWGTDGAEDTANGVVEFMAAGVKIRMTYAEMNADGGKFIYMAWGDVPHRYNNAF